MDAELIFAEDIGFFLCAALMAWHALTYDFIDGEWKKREG